jgi:hypothetical protein
MSTENWKGKKKVSVRRRQRETQVLREGTKVGRNYP